LLPADVQYRIPQGAPKSELSFPLKGNSFSYVF
jgi:hypothetical protein